MPADGWKINGAELKWRPQVGHVTSSVAFEGSDPVEDKGGPLFHPCMGLCDTDMYKQNMTIRHVPLSPCCVSE